MCSHAQFILCFLGLQGQEISCSHQNCANLGELLSFPGWGKAGGTSKPRLGPVVCHCWSQHCSKIKKKVGGKQPVANEAASPTFPTLSSLGVMESPPAAPHCLPTELQHLPHPSPALQHLQRGRKSNTNHKKKKKIPVWFVWSSSSVCKWAWGLTG